MDELPIYEVDEGNEVKIGYFFFFLSLSPCILFQSAFVSGLTLNDDVPFIMSCEEKKICSNTHLSVFFLSFSAFLPSPIFLAERFPMYVWRNKRNLRTVYTLHFTSCIFFPSHPSTQQPKIHLFLSQSSISISTNNNKLFENTSHTHTPVTSHTSDSQSSSFYHTKQNPEHSKS